MLWKTNVTNGLMDWQTKGKKKTGIIQNTKLHVMLCQQQSRHSITFYSLYLPNLSASQFRVLITLHCWLDQSHYNCPLLLLVRIRGKFINVFSLYWKPKSEEKVIKCHTFKIYILLLFFLLFLYRTKNVYYILHHFQLWNNRLSECVCLHIFYIVGNLCRPYKNKYDFCFIFLFNWNVLFSFDKI